MVNLIGIMHFGRQVQPELHASPGGLDGMRHPAR